MYSAPVFMSVYALRAVRCEVPLKNLASARGEVLRCMAATRDGSQRSTED
jgi:hypothetical protein